MNHKKILVASFLALFSLAAFAKTKTTVKDTVSIDFRLNTKSDDGKNHLNWANASSKFKDKYDAVSGASVSHSTGELFSVIHGTNPKTLLAPKGLRSLLLFAVSSPDFLQKDNLQIEKQDDGKIKITFTHRNVNYLILSDEKGNIDIDKSFFIKQNQVADSTQDSSSPENQNPENHENISESENLSVNSVDSVRNSENQNPEDEKNAVPDGFEADKSEEKSKYSGKLKLGLKNDVLTLKGKIRLLEISETE